MAKERESHERGKLADRKRNSREERKRKTKKKGEAKEGRGGRKRKGTDGEVRNVTRNVRQAAFSRLGYGPIPPIFPSFFLVSLPFALYCAWDARAAPASAISLTGYAPCAVRRVVQCLAFWFPARSKRVAGLSWRTNGAFQGCCPWYSRNCVLLFLRMPRAHAPPAAQTALSRDCILRRGQNYHIVVDPNPQADLRPR